MQIEEITLEPIVAAPPNELSRQAYLGDGGQWDRNEDLLYRQLLRYAEDMRRLARDRAWAMAELQAARRETLFRLARMVECNGSPGPTALLRIGILSALVAHELGMSDDYCDQLCTAAPLRDIGKMAVGCPPQGEAGESAGPSGMAMEDHPHVGAAILGGSFSPELQMAEAIALCHHEHVDGSGYPAGLTGTEIPLAARIVAVVDRFDELRRTGMQVAEALSQLRGLAGTAFDHRVVAAMAQCVRDYQGIEALLAKRHGKETGLDEMNLLPHLWKVVASARVPGV